MQYFEAQEINILLPVHDCVYVDKKLSSTADFLDYLAKHPTTPFPNLGISCEVVTPYGKGHLVKMRVEEDAVVHAKSIAAEQKRADQILGASAPVPPASSYESMTVAGCTFNVPVAEDTKPTGRKKKKPDQRFAYTGMEGYDDRSFYSDKNSDEYENGY